MWVWVGRGEREVKGGWGCVGGDGEGWRGK